jgi:hypothetical protein
VLAQQEVHCVALLIDSSVEIFPLSSHADVGLIYSPRHTDSASKSVPLLLEFGHIALDPSQDGCMSQINPALSHHIAQVTIAEFVCSLPAHAKNDYRVMEVSPFE